MDPTGDLYPGIQVVDGRFVVTFANSRTRRLYRTVITADGTVVEERVPTAEPLPSEPPPALPDAVKKQVPADRTVESFMVGAQGAVVVLTSRAPTFFEQLLPRQGNMVEMHRYARDGTEHRRLDVGRPSDIMGLPQVSKVAMVGHAAVVAWMTAEHDVRLTWWNLETSASGSLLLAEGAHWNTSFAVATSGEAILVAYHQARALTPPFPAEGVAIIKTHFIKALPAEAR